MWTSIKDAIPPFDTLVLVKGTGRVTDPRGVEHTWPKYCLAFNQCFNDLCMTCMFEYKEGDFKKFPLMYNVPFEIEEWITIEDIK